MPVLPIIDALILLGWTSLFGGFVLKLVYMTTSFRPTLFGLHPSDFILVAGVCLLFALSLAARTWVKAHEPELLARRRRARLLEAGYDESEQPSFGRPRLGGEEPESRRSASGF
ncbi:MAG: hypothetical protein DCC71_18770 [Proteobacteria bacterium]|nr:MAG: hypothetical protein DCC71_18770 [Pseudomonadota bacterium]